MLHRKQIKNQQRRTGSREQCHFTDPIMTIILSRYRTRTTYYECKSLNQNLTERETRNITKKKFKFHKFEFFFC